MTTFGDLVERTRRRLMTVQREPMNTLAAGVDADDVAWTFGQSIRFVENSRLSCELEDVYVTAVSSGGGTVIRGAYGSVGAAHASGSIVHINPSWSNFEIANAINDTIDQLSAAGLFQVRSTDFDYTPSAAGYDLSGLTGFMSVWRVRYKEPGPEKVWRPIPAGLFRVDVAADATDFASGVQLVLKTGGSPGQPVRVSYRASFTRLAGWTDNVTSVTGIHSQAEDLLSLGASINLMSGLESQRALTTTQPDPRRADDVPARTAVSAMVPLVQRWEERLAEEKTRLMKLYPGAL